MPFESPSVVGSANPQFDGSKNPWVQILLSGEISVPGCLPESGSRACETRGQLAVWPGLLFPVLTLVSPLRLCVSCHSLPLRHREHSQTRRKSHHDLRLLLLPCFRRSGAGTRPRALLLAAPCVPGVCVCARSHLTLDSFLVSQNNLAQQVPNCR